MEILNFKSLFPQLNFLFGATDLGFEINFFPPVSFGKFAVMIQHVTATESSRKKRPALKGANFLTCKNIVSYQKR